MDTPVKWSAKCLTCGTDLILPPQGAEQVCACPNCKLLHRVVDVIGPKGEIMAKNVEQGEVTEAAPALSRRELLEKLRLLDERENDVSSMKKAATKDYSDQLKDIHDEKKDVHEALKKVLPEPGNGKVT